MQINNSRNALNFTALNIRSEARKASEAEILGMAEDIVKDTKYVHLDLVDADAAPYIRTPFGSYGGNFFNITMYNSFWDKKSPYSVAIETYKTNNSYATEHLSPYEQEIMRKNGKTEALKLDFDSKRARLNFYNRVKHAANVYERAAIVARTIDDLILKEEDALNKTGGFSFVSSQAQRALGMDVDLCKVEKILAKNKFVDFQIVGADAAPKIVTPFGIYINRFKPFKPQRGCDDTLYIATQWGGELTQVREKRRGDVFIKTYNKGDNYILKLKFDSPEEAKIAYKKVSNARNKYEAGALVARYMDKLGLGSSV